MMISIFEMKVAVSAEKRVLGADWRLMEALDE